MRFADIGIFLCIVSQSQRTKSGDKLRGGMKHRSSVPVRPAHQKHENMWPVLISPTRKAFQRRSWPTRVDEFTPPRVQRAGETAAVFLVLTANSGKERSAGREVVIQHLSVHHLEAVEAAAAVASAATPFPLRQSPSPLRLPRQICRAGRPGRF